MVPNADIVINKVPVGECRDMAFSRRKSKDGSLIVAMDLVELTQIVIVVMVFMAPSSKVHERGGGIESMIPNKYLDDIHVYLLHSKVSIITPRWVRH